MRITLATFALVFAGCNADDGDKLAAVGKVVTEKVKRVVPKRAPISEPASEATPTSRVQARIQTDVFFANLAIEVTSTDEAILLRGAVPSREHADRAEQLARETIGVSKVVNELVVEP